LEARTIITGRIDEGKPPPLVLDNMLTARGRVLFSDTGRILLAVT
jgi:hypothetical protein